MSELADFESEPIEGLNPDGGVTIPLFSRIGHNIWMGGCPVDSVPPETQFIVSLYPWAEYTVPEGVTVTRAWLHDVHEVPDVPLLVALACWVSTVRQIGVTFVHCLLPGTMVGAYEPQRVEDIVGDVISGDGRQRKILARMEHEHDGLVVNLKARGVPVLQVTPEHPVLVLKPYRTSGGFIFKPGYKSNFQALDRYRAELAPVWVPAGEVKPGDFLLSPKADLAAQGAPVALTPELAWLFGLYIADGGTSGEHAFSITLSLKDDCARAVRALFALGARPTVKDESTYRRITVSSKDLRDKFVSWFGRGSTTKRIPAWLHGEYASDVLAGYLHGDGYVHPRGQNVPFTTSLTLAWQVWQLAVSAGEYAYLYQVRKGGERYSIKGRDGVASPGWNVEWRSSAQHYNDWWGDYYCLAITDVELERYKGPVYDLEVSRDHSYLANGVVVHNCQAGLNRSGLVLALAMMVDGATADQAISHLRSARHELVLCNSTFEAWLRNSGAAALETTSKETEPSAAQSE